MELFPLIESWWFYLAFTAFVLLLLTIDLGIFHKKAHRVTSKEATIWCAIWVVLAFSFLLVLYHYALWKFSRDPRLLASPGFDLSATARRVALEFLAGYIVEYSLSIDNIFIFVLVLTFFGIPSRLQHRVLFYGILGAMIFRALFIAAGSLLIHYTLVVLVFGGFLIVTGIRMMFAPEKRVDPEKNPLIRLFRRYVPVTQELRDQQFFVRVDGKWHATPLFVTLLFVELTDIVFAVDSVPTIFALTREPLIVFTSNVFAILGLRSLYFLLLNALDKFHLLKYGLATVLVFVGVKMVWLNHNHARSLPIGISLGIITATVGMSVALSLLFPKEGEE